MPKFAHFNFNVLDLQRSIDFYREALGLKEHSRIDGPEGAFTIVYLTDGTGGFLLELTWLRDRDKPYDLGECEFHLAFTVDDMEAEHQKHVQMGCVCYENHDMGVYFITDPDGYWIEILPRPS
jgi:lactoylglutathione lyase